MASSAVHRSLGIARAIPPSASAGAARNQVAFFASYLHGAAEGSAANGPRLDIGDAAPGHDVARRCTVATRSRTLSQSGHTSSLSRCAPLPYLAHPPPPLSRTYASTAHAYAHDRSRDEHVVHAPVYRQARHRDRERETREWMSPIARTSREEERPYAPAGAGRTTEDAAESTRPDGLPPLADSRAQRAWSQSLDLAAVQQVLGAPVLGSTHLTPIIRWLRKQPLETIPPDMQDSLLSRVLAFHNDRLTRQATSFVQDSLRALRKGQTAGQTFSERETRLRRAEIMLGITLGQQDLHGKAAELALRSLKTLRRSVVWPTLLAYLGHLWDQRETDSVVDFAVSAFPGIPFIANAVKHSGGDADRIASIIHEAFAAIADPVACLRERLEAQGDDPVTSRQTRWYGIILLRSLLHNEGRQVDAMAVFEQICNSGEQLDEDVTSSLYAWLGSVGMHGEARRVYEALAQPGPLSQQARRRAASMFASAGEFDMAEQVLGPATDRHNASAPVPAELLSRLRVLANAGKVQEAEAAAEQALPGVTGKTPQTAPASATGQRQLRRDVLSLLLAGRAKAADIDGALHHLRSILALGETPSLVDFNTILKIFAQRRDEESAGHLLDQMRSIGISPDLVTFSTLISLYSSRKEVEKAQEIWQEMLQAGVQPDAVAVSGLINAHVESGSWQGVVEIYRELGQSIKHDSSVVNVMLKGLVLLAAPVAEVERVFQEAYPAGTGADARAWALLIQSACEADRFDIALDAYEALIATAGQPGAHAKLTPHVFSILMAGYLRKGDPESAMAVLAEMESRGIARTSVIHGIIVKALADGKWPDKELSEEQYADQAAQQLKGQVTRRGSHAENVYAPLITANSRRSNLNAAETYFRKIVSAGVQPSLPMYTTLLDAYRRAGDLAGLQRTWQSLYKLVTAPIITERGVVAVPASQRNMLCIPLSIYMDALSAAGEHETVARVWQDVNRAGFAFDAHNWNHLVLALVKAGEIERAFQITEDVLIPRHEEVQARKIASDRTADAAEATTEDVLDDAEGEFSTEPAQRPPNRRHQYRRRGRDDAAAELRGGILDRTSAAASDQQISNGGAINSADVNLNIFESWRPADVVWRPSYLTIAVLDRAYSRLEKGKAVLALAWGEEEELLEDAEVQAAVDSADLEADTVPGAKSSSPLVLLGRINSRYAKTVGLIMFHRRKRRGDRPRR